MIMARSSGLLSCSSIHTAQMASNTLNTPCTYINMHNSCQSNACQFTAKASALLLCHVTLHPRCLSLHWHHCFLREYLLYSSSRLTFHMSISAVPSAKRVMLSWSRGVFVCRFLRMCHTLVALPVPLPPQASQMCTSGSRRACAQMP